MYLFMYAYIDILVVEYTFDMDSYLVVAFHPKGGLYLLEILYKIFSAKISMDIGYA